MSEDTETQERMLEEFVTANDVVDSSQIDANIEADAISAEFEVSEMSETSRSARKRRKRKRKRQTIDSEAHEAIDDSIPELELVQSGFHSAFHGVVYDEEGNPRQVTLRQENIHQVNRKRQKRLGTCTFQINTEMKDMPAELVMPPKRSRYDTESSAPIKPKKPKVMNLEVRIHKYENDYDTVVKHWYSTLDWIDKAAMELQAQQNAEEGETYDEDGQYEEEVQEYDENGDEYQQPLEQPGSEVDNEVIQDGNKEVGDDDNQEENQGTDKNEVTEIQENVNITENAETAAKTNAQRKSSNKTDCKYT